MFLGLVPARTSKLALVTFATPPGGGNGWDLSISPDGELERHDLYRETGLLSIRRKSEEVTRRGRP